MSYTAKLFVKPILTAGLLTFLPAFLPAAPTIVKTTVFATGTAVSGTAPDSIALSPGGVWVAYTNGADSTGKSGGSLVVEYDHAGTILNQITFAGYVDGLKYDEERDLIWVLQNQDGNSMLTLIDHLGNTVSPALAVTSGSRGYDDVVFLNGAIYMSYTNPSGPTDATIQYMTGLSPVTFSTVLTMGATGTNLATQQAGQVIAQNDPDSLKATPFGGLMLTSGDDGQIIFVHDLESIQRSVSFLTVLDSSTGKNVSGLDDAVFATSASGSFYVTDTSNNQVVKVDVTGLTPMSLFASVGSLKSVVSVDMKTGNATAFVTNLGSPHGLAFVANFNSLFGQ